MVRRSKYSSLFIAVLGVSAWCGATTASAQLLVSNTPKFAASTKNLGKTNPATVVDVTVWLKPTDKAGLDALAKELYDPQSPNYRHWISKSDFSARFAPTAKQSQAVKDFFTGHGLKVTTVGPDNFFVRAQGTIANVSNAFHTEINNFEVNGKIYRGNTSEPVFDSSISSFVSAVYGLDNLEYKHPLVTREQAIRGRSGAAGVKPAASGGSSYNPFPSACFTGPETQTYTGGGATADITGNAYTKSNLGCGYVPAEIRTAYNLDALYKEGYDGTGQTIVIVDWCGSPTIFEDANAFSAQYGLPPLTSKNFSIINFPTPSTCAAPDAEINLDVEWAHAIAPGANIDLLVPPSATFQDIDAATFYAVDYQLGNSLSGSFGSEEFYTPPAYLIEEDLISETAAVFGISTNYSSGDSGDFTFDFPQFNPPSVSSPADSPYATAVGGVSLALTSKNGIAWQTGWGTNESVLVSGTPVDPPFNAGFVFGSGGGPSGFFAKPSYQKALKGPARQVPDISWLGDPFTGAVIAITSPFVYPPLQYETIGGTSLACPMFSALWAIANQEAGKPLGQAAPYLYTMPASTITDVLPYSSSTNVTEKLIDSAGTTNYSAAALAAPLENTKSFYSAIWDYPLNEDTVYVLIFGTDSGLVVTKGWDNVTGVGTPNGKAFADYFKK